MGTGILPTQQNRVHLTLDKCIENVVYQERKRTKLTNVIFRKVVFTTTISIDNISLCIETKYHLFDKTIMVMYTFIVHAWRNALSLYRGTKITTKNMTKHIWCLNFDQIKKKSRHRTVMRRLFVYRKLSWDDSLNEWIVAMECAFRLGSLSPTWAPSQYKDRLIYVWRFPC